MDKKKLEKKILEKQGELEELRNPYESVWDEILSFCLPRNLMYDGKNRASKAYDGTAQHALQIMTAGYCGQLFGRSLKWFAHTLPEKYMDIPKVREWLQDTEQHFYYVFNNSNFYESMNNIYENGGSIGTSSHYIEEDIKKGVPAFMPLHPYSVYIAENRYKQVDYIHIKQEKTAREILEEYPGVGKRTKKEFEDEPFKKHTVITALFYRYERDLKKVGNDNKPIASIHVLEDAKEEEKIIKVSGYDTWPVPVWRWRTTQNSVYGISPAWDALTDILRGQQISKDILKASNFAVSPMIAYVAEFGEIVIEPDGMYPVSDMRQKPEAIYKNSNYPFGLEIMDRIDKSVREHLMVDYFLLLNNAERNKTATEVMELAGEKAAILSSIVGRSNTELFNPIFDRVFDIEMRAGRLPEPPEQLLEVIGDERIDINYLGPLAQAQKLFAGTRSIRSGLEQLAPVMQIKPEVTDNFDWDQVARNIANDANFPQKTIKDKEVVKQLREQREQIAQQERQLAYTKELSEAVPNLNKKIEENSPLQLMGEAVG